VTTAAVVCSAVVKTILCYGDSNTWGCIPLTAAQPPRRYGPAQRWPGVLRRELGDGFGIVEEGLNGRTTVWDDPLEPSRSGKELLVPCLLTHQPIELVIVMLGTNDLKGRFGVGARDIAAGAGLLLDATVADARSCPWLDAGAHVRSSDDDGIHLDAPSHEQLGVVVAQQVRRLLA
jgi:lysophospholipase L1-like esterase